MDFRQIFLSSTSVSFELINYDIVNTKKYTVYLNDELVLENDKNIFSLYNLIPNTEYEILIIQENEEAKKTFKTLDEYVSLNVKRFGAKGDGVSNDTNYLQAAILACPDNGRVFIPKGTYLTGPLFLRSNITIELDKDAKLLGDTNRYNYPILPGVSFTSDEKDEYNLGSWEGNPLNCYASIITGINVKNAKLVGLGIIDGNANNSDWWKNPKLYTGAYRPRGLFLNHCEGVEVQGLTFTNTPSWNLHPYFSNNLKFVDMKLINPKDSPNTDGCDPESCTGVDILGVYFSVGDDCIAIKSGKIYMGRKYKLPSSNFNIRNCSMNFGHGSIVLGSEMSGGIKDITVSQCLFNQTDRGLRIKTRRGRGKDAIIDGITFENIKMQDVLTPLVINMFYFCDPDGHTEYVQTKEKLPVDDRTPYIGKFNFRNIRCENVNVAAGTFYGLPEAPIKSINLENIYFHYAKDPIEGRPAMMDNLSPMKGKGLIFSNVGEVTIKNVSFDGLNDEKFELDNVGKFKEE